MASPAAAPKASRLQFLDLLRGWAGIVMIEVHVFNGLIRPELRETGWFHGLNFLNGLVAPSFLFCAGAGFVTAIERKWDDFAHLRTPARTFVRRLLYILAAGYFLHLPRLSLSYLVSRATPNEIQRALQVDILQTISATLLLAFFLAVALRSLRAFVVASAAIGLGLVFGASPLWRVLPQEGLGVLLTGVLRETAESHFPLVPWSAYLFGGAALQWSYSASSDPARWARRVALAGFLLTVGSQTAVVLGFDHTPAAFDRAAPTFFLTRFGVVLLLYAFFWWFTSAFRETRLRVWTLLYGRESLLVYVVHLMIVYGSVFRPGIASYYGGVASPLLCLAVTLAVTLGMGLLAAAWSALKAKKPAAANALAWGWVAVAAVVLIVR